MRPSSALGDFVAVVWPPVWNAFDLHVAVPALCGFLASQGVQVRQYDLNIEFFRYLAAEETIEALVGKETLVLPPDVRRAIDCARQYYRILHAPLPPGYVSRFSEDAEAQLLKNALAIFNHFNPETCFSTLAVYHTGDAEDSSFMAEFAEKDVGNPFAAFYRKAFLPELAAQPPKILGISVCGSFQLGAALTLARLVKEADPRICIVIGGAFFSTLPEVLLERKAASNLFRHVDAYVFNEGEIPFLRLIQLVFATGVPAAGSNVLLRGQLQLRYEPLECLPPDQVATSLFGDGVVSRYFRPNPRIPIEVSRGCYWGKCTFCNLASGANERYRGLRIDAIIGNIRTLTARHGASEVQFSTLAMAPKILRGVARRLLDKDIHVSWSAWIRPEKTLTSEDIGLFKQAGCSSLSVTPESFDRNTLSKMNKGFDLQHLIRIVGELKQAGLCSTVNIIPGFPGETVNDFLSTVEVCKDLRVRGEFFPFCLLKNSPIYRNAERYGVSVREQLNKDLAVAVPFVYTPDPAALGGIALIKTAARCYPKYISADDPLAGYTFDFSAAGTDSLAAMPEGNQLHSSCR
jgi:anaerobic magnesium-protoporphyrin IX monomethyl ester cyclase